jgi:phage-related protein (TIGR01555 family)
MSKRRPPKIVQPAGPVSAADGKPPASPKEAMDGFLNLVSALGSSSDKNAYSTYAVPIQMVQLQLDAMYRGSWVAGKVVDVPVADMTREWVSLTWDGRDKGDKDANAIYAAEKALEFRQRVRTGMKWGRLYGGACTIMVIDGQDMAEPLDLDSIKKGSLLNLVTLDRWRFPSVVDVEQDLTSPNYNKPVMYTIADSGQMVHWTRVVRWPGRELPYYQWRQNAMWDDSELFHVLNAVQNYDGACSAAGSMLHEANVDIISIKGLVQALSMNGQDSKIAQRYQLGMMNKSLNKALLLDSEKETWQQKVSQFSGVEAILVRFMIDVSGAADIPTTRLFGQSPAGLSSTGEADIRNYYDRLAGDQESKLHAPLMRLYEVLVRSTLGGLPEGFELTFNPLWQMSDVEASTRDMNRSTMDGVYLTAGVVSRGLAARELKDRGVYRTMEDEDVEEAEEKDDQEAEAAEKEANAPAANFDPKTGQPLAPGAAAAAPSANQGANPPATAANTKDVPAPAEVSRERQLAKESGDSAAPTTCPKWFQDCLDAHGSIVIVGGPKHGKTTLASFAKDRPVFSTDDLLTGDAEAEGGVNWDQTPASIAARQRAIGAKHVIEGVQTARGLRSGLVTADCVIHMNGPKAPMTDGQATMAKGVETIFSQWKAANPDANVVNEPSSTATIADGMAGDTFKHDGTGWLVMRDGKRIGGPYKTLSKARRRLKMG